MKTYACFHLLSLGMYCVISWYSHCCYQAAEKYQHQSAQEKTNSTAFLGVLCLIMSRQGHLSPSCSSFLSFPFLYFRYCLLPFCSFPCFSSLGYTIVLCIYIMASTFVCLWDFWVCKWTSLCIYIRFLCLSLDSFPSICFVPFQCVYTCFILLLIFRYLFVL